MIILGVPNISQNDVAFFFSVIAIIVGIIIGFIWLVLRFFNFNSSRYITILKVAVTISGIGLTIIWTIAFFYFVIDWYIHSSTSVSKSKLKGLYEIDTLYFRGKNANWQHSRYKLEIDNDSLKLMILSKNRVIKEVKRKIINIEVQNRSFFTFHDEYWSDSYIKNKPKRFYFSSKKDSLMQMERDSSFLNDSLNHHMLRINPSLLLKPHYFRVVIYSTKYKNMFFKQVD